jgi:uncharacterized membrane protein YeaQ/YmgE (transglycosylase-associated protein family)
MNILCWIIFGICAGMALQKITNSKEEALPLMVFSILGSLSGGIAGSLLFGMNILEFNAISVTLALVSSVILLLIQKSLDTKHTSSLA